MTPPTQYATELKAFLSHRYKSPEINLFFFQLLSEDANVQFDVDIGINTTNVTRLERLIRDSDAFIGIYPVPIDPDKSATLNDLLAASRYFRLELDIAIRARKPILVFFDRRYGGILNLPENCLAIAYDAQEILGKGGSPQKPRYQRAISDFFRYVNARMSADAERPLTPLRIKVGLIVPTDKGEASSYTKDEIQAIKRVAQDNQILELEEMSQPWTLNGNTYKWLESLDWVIVDVGETAMKTGLVGYLHGSLIPAVRLYKGHDSITDVEGLASYKFLFGGLEVGYQKDIVFWNTKTELRDELGKRLQSLKSSSERITTKQSAEEYFLKASKRAEAMFLSYSGKDQDVAHQISALLKRRFQEVFDYRDGESITPGQPWLKEIFDKLAKSAFGVPLLSENYLNSRNCLHEAEEMVARQDLGKMIVIPVKLDTDQLDLPTWMQNSQYLRIYEHQDYESTVEKLIESFDHGLKNN